MTTPATDARFSLMTCWALKQPDNAEHLRDLIDAIEAQRTIPGIVSLESGPRTRRVDWEGPDDAFDHAMVLTFGTAEAARAYPDHPAYRKLFATISRLGSNVRSFWIDR